MAQQSITSFFSAPKKRNFSDAAAESDPTTAICVDEDGDESTVEEHESIVGADCEPESQCLCTTGSKETTNPPVAAARLDLESSLPDIGRVVKLGLQTKEVTAAVAALSTSEKYGLLFKHASPPAVLPSTRSHGCNRKFNKSWLDRYPWLVYSTAVDGVFCAPCAILCPELVRADKGLLVNVPFRNWFKVSDALATHAIHKYHRNMMQAADTLRATVDNPDSRLDVMVSGVLQDRLANNKHILEEIVRAILYLTKQGLPLRGHREQISSNSNPGNFLALLKDRARTDSKLKKHLEDPEARNATYLSPRSQNDIIGVIGFDIIRANLVKEIRDAKFFAVLADEASSHNIEHLSVCVRFVDTSGQIREEFLSFVKMERVRATDIEEAITGLLKDVALSLDYLRGQGYDGASTMSGERSGVQKRILEKQPKSIVHTLFWSLPQPGHLRSMQWAINQELHLCRQGHHVLDKGIT